MPSFPTRRSSDLRSWMCGPAVSRIRRRSRRTCGSCRGTTWTARCRSSSATKGKRGMTTTSSGPTSTGSRPRTSSGCRSEEHTSELQSQFHLVCRLLQPRYALFPYTTLFRSEIVDVWACRFPDQAAFEAYMRELPRDDLDGPLSEFISDQGQAWYDHDFLGSHFHGEPSADVERLQIGRAHV